jgi:hypothetical protein
MKLAYAALIFLLMAGAPVVAATAVAAPTSGQNTYGINVPWMVATEHMVVAEVWSVSPNGNSVTLTNGMTLTAAKDLSTEPLTPGLQITAMYKKEGGKDILTWFWIEEGNGG